MYNAIESSNQGSTSPSISPTSPPIFGLDLIVFEFILQFLPIG